MAIRILIADRQEMFREALRRLLEAEPEFSVVGDTDDGERLASLAADAKADVLLLELNLRKRSGIDALGAITECSEVRPLLLMDHPSNGEIVQALLSGARGVVQKSVSAPLLFKAIRTVAADEYWLSHAGIGELVISMRLLATRVEQQARREKAALSPQQIQIVEAIAAGCTNKEIAEDLSLSERTVKYHLTRIFAKFGVSGRMELARFSLKNKLTREA
jgi:two-component system response regulator DegU